MKELKHVFFVHSAITYIVACEIIKLKGLRPEDVVLLSHRGFQVPSANWRVHVFPYSWSPEPFRFQLNFIRSWKKIRRFDDFIDKLNDKCPFLMYLPHSGFRVLKLLISHPRCQGFNYIEEGLGSYSRKEYFDKPSVNYRVHPLDHLLNRGRIKERLYYNEGYQAVYGLFKESFPGFENRVIFQEIRREGEVLPINYGRNADFKRFNNAQIIVLDAISEHGILERRNHLKAFRKLLRQLAKNNIREAYIKYHPAQIDTQEVELFREAAEELQDSILLTEIEQDVFLEDIAKFSLEPTFYVNVSSVGFYAAKEGQKVYSWAPYIMELDENYRTWFSGVNKVFLASVQLLDVEERLNQENQN